MVHDQRIKSVVVYGFTLGIAGLFSLFRIPIIIQGIGIESFGILLIMVQSLSLPMLFQGATRLHFRSKFTALECKDFNVFEETYLSIFKILFKKTLLILFLPFISALILNIYIFTTLKILDIENLLSISAVLILLSLTAITTGSQFGKMDSQSKHNHVTAIDIISSVVSLPFAILLNVLEAKTYFYIFVMTMTQWIPPIYLMIKSMCNSKKKKTKSTDSIAFFRDIKVTRYITQTIGSNLTLNFNALLIGAGSSPKLAANSNIAEKFATFMFVPTAAMAPIQHVQLTKYKEKGNNQLAMKSYYVIFQNSVMLAALTLPTVIGAKLLSTQMGIDLSFRIILSVTLAYMFYGIFTTIQMCNTSMGVGTKYLTASNLGFGITSALLTLILAPKLQDSTLLYSIGGIYFIACGFALQKLLRQIRNS